MAYIRGNQVLAAEYAGTDEKYILIPRHREILEIQSSIPGPVIAGRGYHSATPARGEKYGYKGAARCYGVAMPIHGTDGKVRGCQVRRDVERVVGDKKRRYESKPGCPAVLDVHPFNREKLKDPSIRCWICEGLKKGDALTGRGELAVTLTGVFSWRGTNKHGGKMTLDDWDDVAINGRDFHIAFDADVMIKAEVLAALRRLRSLLLRRGAAHVYYVDWERLGVDYSGN